MVLLQMQQHGRNMVEIVQISLFLFQLTTENYLIGF